MTKRRVISWSLATAVVAGISLPLGATSTSTPAATETFRIEQIFGQRPVIPVRLNGHPFHMVIHSNANFFMQIPHRLAKAVGITNRRHAGSFGIEAPGKVSRLGRDEGQVRSLTIGGRSYSDVPASIFETPGDQSTGMLGLDWITANRLVIDYPAHRVHLNSHASVGRALRERLLHAGYAAIPMQRNFEKRYTVVVSIGNTTRPMTVSTVAGMNIDKSFADAANIRSEKSLGIDSGPRGATVRNFATKAPIVLTIHGWKSRPIADAQVVDMAAYMSTTRAVTDTNGGALGADFLIANAAIVDFGNDVLYLRSTTHRE